MRYSLLVLSVAVLACTVAFAQSPDILVLGDFENGTWSGLAQDGELARDGDFSGKWANLQKVSSLTAPGVPTDLSSYDRLVFWLHSAKANSQRLTMVFTSENPAQDGWDYYFHHMTIDWSGWKRFDLSLADDFDASRSPLGWDRISAFVINASGWDHEGKADSLLHLDGVKLLRDPILAVVTGTETQKDGNLFRVVHTVTLQSRSASPVKCTLSGMPVTDDHKIFQFGDYPQELIVGPNEVLTVEVPLVADSAALAGAQPLTREEFRLIVKIDRPEIDDQTLEIAAAVPLPAREHPFLFGGAGVFEQAEARAKKFEWAAEQLKNILRHADAALEVELVIPEESGQWSHHYVCKKCGARLSEKDGKHVCTRCGEVYTGWPYDQVMIANKHHRNWSRMHQLALGYAFTGNEKYAEAALKILLGYAEKYPEWDYHDVRGGQARSGGRIFAQTLDESTAIINVAWAYDMIYNSPAITAEDRDIIENRFLREVVRTIQRHDAGISNWQSWHNAGMAAVGFCLQDDEIASHAINGRSGLRFQLANSILDDGFWYEGTAAYHFYALSALFRTAEIAHFAGIDFYDDQRFKSLFDAPLLYTFPDLKFPAVNDSDVFSLTGQAAMYELAYTRFAEPAYLSVAQYGNRNSLNALLWGLDELPAAPVAALASRNFTGIGAAVLRQGVGNDQLYLHLDYGPHGGGHGHPDKLAFILYGLGQQLAPDAGRLAYAAPMQASWYRQTIAHNTICVDGTSQKATEGVLELMHSVDGFAVAAAQCDTAYSGVMLRRTMTLTDSYVIDIFSAQSDADHVYDLAYHNFGTLKPGLETVSRGEALAEDNGYQHIRDIKQARTDDGWFADFVVTGGTVRVNVLGSEDTELFFGMGMTDNPPADCPMLIARRSGLETTFTSVIEIAREEPQISSIETIPVTGGDGIALKITRGDATDLFMLAETSGVQREIEGYKSDARVTWIQNAGSDSVRMVVVD